MKTKRKNPSSSKPTGFYKYSGDKIVPANRSDVKFMASRQAKRTVKNYSEAAKILRGRALDVYGLAKTIKRKREEYQRNIIPMTYKSKTPLDVVINRSIDEEVAKQCNATHSKTAEPQDCNPKKLADAIRRQGPWETNTVVLGDEINSELDQHIAMAEAMAENSASELESNYSKGLRIAYKISRKVINRHLLAFIQKSGSTITITCEGQAKTFVHKTLDT